MDEFIESSMKKWKLLQYIHFDTVKPITDNDTPNQIWGTFYLSFMLNKSFNLTLQQYVDIIDV